MIAKKVRFETFVGRDAELGFLEDGLFKANRGGGSAVVIVGDAGLGKTRLVQEFRNRHDGVDASFVAGACLEYARSPLGPFLEILRSAGEERSIRLLGAHQDSSLEPAHKKLRVFNSILDCFRERPVDGRCRVIVIEDVHWADDATLQMLEHLVKAIEELPLYVAFTCRADAVKQDQRIGALLSRLLRNEASAVYLEPLSRGEVRFLLNAVFEQNPDLPKNAAERVEDLAGGNPLYLEELLCEAIDRFASSERTSERIPDTLRATVLERVARLSLGAREILIKAAVLVDDFDMSILAAVAESNPVNVAAALQSGVDENFLWGTECSGRYRFRHVLIREVLHSQLTATSAAFLHARAAEFLENGPESTKLVAELAYHWSAAGNAPMAIRYNGAAGDAAMALFMYRDAARCFRRALAFAPHSRLRRAELEENLAYALYSDGSLDESKTHFSAAIDGYVDLGKAQDAARLIDLLFTVYWFDGDTEGGLSFASSALSIAEGEIDQTIRDRILIRTAGFLNVLELSVEADDLLNRVSAAPVTDLASQVTLRGLRAIMLATRGRFGEAIREFEAGMNLALGEQAHRLTVKVAGNLSVCHVLTGDLNEAERVARYAMDCAENNHLSLVDYCTHALQYARVLFLRGRLAEAVEVIQNVLACGAAYGEMRVHLADTGIPIALAAMREDLLARLSDESVIEFAFSQKRSPDIAVVSAAFAKLYVHRGRPDTAAALLRRAIAQVSRSPFALDMLIDVAKHGSLGDVVEARQYVIEICSRRPRAVGSAYTAHFDAVLSGRRRNWSDRKRFARIAATAYGDLEMPMYQADALELAGRQREALSLYRKIGAVAEIARLERLFADRGHRGGPLTRRQAQIADLIVAGQTNRQIASELGVSEKTLESHITAIHRRLGIESRGALAAYLTEQIG
jgi:DNA-binding CsgD family transcriptional regulator/tetratricopeptide (TPR) repeat protein